MQAIILVEADKKSKSDYMYIKTCIEHFFEVSIKLSPVYMGGKMKYAQKEKEIQTLINSYSAAGHDRSESKVFLCIDVDNIHKSSEDKNRYDTIVEYCAEKHYELIWFFIDIEHVFWGEIVSDSKKKDKAKDFIQKKQLENVEVHSLEKTEFNDTHEKTSNILAVFGKYLTRRK